ncbi:NAD-dependent DNA ligase LigA [Gracilinema caldarium]|uniref:NAD-dependent DNA ligase LigA n=1 Tax=Gracilinema caldarium TaxID=215591 RepID=UPI0026EFCE6E|nr:NAD-dependent DNA ligase LigA [Gracilinema caldarium]
MNQDRIATLERLIRRYQASYYNGEAEISDAEFDALWDELKSLAPDHPLFAQVGKDADDGFPKASHLIPMGSQEKAANPEEFRAWAMKTAASAYVVQYKLDGASLELQYEKGELARAVSRGDGLVGDDITPNARRMKGVLIKLDTDFTGGVRGEVLMPRAVWQTKYNDKANCRNAANGLMRRKDGAGCEDLELVCYDVSDPNNDSMFREELEKIRWLEARGFMVTPARVFTDPEQIIQYRETVAAQRDSLPYDIDGLVVKDIKTNMDDLRRTRPERQIAFKFDLEEAITILRAVEWSESGSTYTPIGIVDPVRLAGTTVQRANLNNPDMIRALGLKIGSPVRVVKRGEIIPKIEGLAHNMLDQVDPAAMQEIELPQVCSTCGTNLVDGGTRLYCPNAQCPKRIHHRIEKWISVLDIREFGDKLLQRLYEAGRLNRIADLYTLTEEELSALDRMGELSAKKVIRHLRSPKTLSLSTFVAGFDFDGVGELIMERVTDAGYNTLEKLRRATVEELANIYGLGEITARTIEEGLAETKTDMDAVLATGIISIAEPPKEEALLLRGYSFCFTGELRSMKRSEAEERVKALGGQAKSSVVKDLSYLITNDPASGSSKNQKARELGIPVISEEQFLEVLEKPEKAQCLGKPHDNGPLGLQSENKEGDKPLPRDTREHSWKKSPPEQTAGMRQGDLFEN